MFSKFFNLLITCKNLLSNFITLTCIKKQYHLVITHSRGIRKDYDQQNALGPNDSLRFVPPVVASNVWRAVVIWPQPRSTLHGRCLHWTARGKFFGDDSRSTGIQPHRGRFGLRRRHAPPFSVPKCASVPRYVTHIAIAER